MFSQRKNGTWAIYNNYTYDDFSLAAFALYHSHHIMNKLAQNNMAHYLKNSLSPHVLQSTVMHHF